MRILSFYFKTLFLKRKNIPTVSVGFFVAFIVYFAIVIIGQRKRIEVKNYNTKNYSNHHANFPVLIPTSLVPDEKTISKINNEACQSPPGDCIWPVYIQSGYGTSTLPVICWQNRNILGRLTSKEAAATYRGLHAVVVKRHAPSEIAFQFVFDTYLNDDNFVSFLLNGVDEGDVLLLASHDDINTGLHDFARNILNHFGSKEISRVEFRDAFVMVGQKGADKGTAIEMLRHKRPSEEFPQRVSVTGCFNPADYGPLKPFPPEYVLRQGQTLLRKGVMPNCGLQQVCPSPNLFPVSMKTGVILTDGPELCIDSHVVFHHSYNVGTRGFNLAIYNPDQRQVTAFDSFDLQEIEPSRLIRFFDSVEGDEILFGVIHEDASQDNLAEDLLSRFGVTIGAQLHPFSIGYFIAQRNSSSLALETVRHYFQTEQRLIGEPLELAICLPLQLRHLRFPDFERGQLKMVDLIERNSPKTEFCEKYPGSYGEFCSQPLRLIANFHRSDMFSFNLPIFVMAGSDLLALAKTLETIVGQNFIVDFAMGSFKVVCASQFAVATHFEEVEELANLFSFRLVILDAETFASLHDACLKYATEVTRSLKEDWFAFLEPGVELGPDFFNFLHRILSKMQNVVGISGWNSLSGDNERRAFLTDDASILPSPCFLASVRYNFNDSISQQGQLFVYPEVSRCFKLQCKFNGFCQSNTRTVLRLVDEPIKLLNSRNKEEI